MMMLIAIQFVVGIHFCSLLSIFVTLYTLNNRHICDTFVSKYLTFEPFIIYPIVHPTFNHHYYCYILLLPFDIRQLILDDSYWI